MTDLETQIRTLAEEIALLRMAHHPERSVKTKEAALFLAISATTLSRIVSAGLLHPVMLTEDMTFEMADLKQLREQYKGKGKSLLRVLEQGNKRKAA